MALRLDGAGQREPARAVFERDELAHQLPRPVKGMVQAPERAAPLGLDQRRRARALIALGCLPRAVDPDHEERQPARADALERGEPVRDLFEPRVETPLQQLDIIARRLARAQETGIGHHQRGGEIAEQVAAIKALGDPIGKARAAHQRIDLGARLVLGELIARGKGA